MAELETIRQGGEKNKPDWTARLLYGGAGAAVAGAPLLSGGCPGACAGCLRCGIGVGAAVVLVIAGQLVRRMRSP